MRSRDMLRWLPPSRTLGGRGGAASADDDPAWDRALPAEDAFGHSCGGAESGGPALS